MNRRGIGGTDLAAVCAYYLPQYADEWAKWSTVADLWMLLAWNVERPDSPLKRRGRAAEPRLRRAFLDAYGGVMEPKPEPWIVRHQRMPFVSVSPDDVWLSAVEKSGPEVGRRLHRIYVEFKSANRFALYPPSGKPSRWGPPESDIVPEGYALQVQLGMDVLEIDTAHLLVGFGSDAKDEHGEPAFYYSETRRYVLRRDPSIIEMALQYAARFHAEHVATRIPPSVEPEANLLTWRILKKLQPHQLDEVHALVNGGMSHRQVAKRIGLTPANVSRLVRCVFKEQSCKTETEAAPSQL